MGQPVTRIRLALLCTGLSFASSSSLMHLFAAIRSLISGSIRCSSKALKISPPHAAGGFDFWIAIRFRILSLSALTSFEATKEQVSFNSSVSLIYMDITRINKDNDMFSINKKSSMGVGRGISIRNMIPMIPAVTRILNRFKFIHHFQ